MSTDTSTTQPSTDWRKTLSDSSALHARAGDARKKAGRMLWDGAQAAITEWLPKGGSDASGEALYTDVIAALGKERKGEASKIRTVALAVRDHGLVTSVYPSLAKAYAEARALTKTKAEQQGEDDALGAAVKSLADSAPKTAGTPESAAKIVLAQGPSKAAALLLDALGASDNAAHRAFVRAVAQEAASRVKPAAKTKKASAPKKGVVKAQPKGAPKVKAQPKDGAAKPKPKPTDGTTKVEPATKPTVKAKPKPVRRGAVV